MYQNLTGGGIATEAACRQAGRQPGKQSSGQKRKEYRLFYFGSKHNFGVRGKLAEYCRKESSTVEITHQSNASEKPHNVFWLRTYGLDSWCVETELGQAEIQALLEKDTARIVEKISAERRQKTAEVWDEIANYLGCDKFLPKDFNFVGKFGGTVYLSPYALLDDLKWLNSNLNEIGSVESSDSIGVFGDGGKAFCKPFVRVIKDGERRAYYFNEITEADRFAEVYTDFCGLINRQGASENQIERKALC